MGAVTLTVAVVVAVTVAVAVAVAVVVVVVVPVNLLLLKGFHSFFYRDDTYYGYYRVHTHRRRQHLYLHMRCPLRVEFPAEPAK